MLRYGRDPLTARPALNLFHAVQSDGGLNALTRDEASEVYDWLRTVTIREREQPIMDDIQRVLLGQ